MNWIQRSHAVVIVGRQVEQLVLVIPHDFKIHCLRALNHAVAQVDRLVAVVGLVRILDDLLLLKQSRNILIQTGLTILYQRLLLTRRTQRVLEVVLQIELLLHVCCHLVRVHLLQVLRLRLLIVVVIVDLVVVATILNIVDHTALCFTILLGYGGALF